MMVVWWKRSCWCGGAGNLYGGRFFIVVVVAAQQAGGTMNNTRNEGKCARACYQMQIILDNFTDICGKIICWPWRKKKWNDAAIYQNKYVDQQMDVWLRRIILYFLFNVICSSSGWLLRAVGNNIIMMKTTQKENFTEEGDE